MYDWNYELVARYADVLARGVSVTLALNFMIIAFGSLGGVLLATLRAAGWRPITWLVIPFSEVFRALPVLVVIIWMYYCLPMALGYKWKLDGFGTAVAALSLNLSAVVSEIIRAGFQSLPRDPIEAARVLGFSPWQRFRYIEFPLAWRRMIPALVSQYVNTFKLSALASTVAVPELLYQASSLISITSRPLELYTTVAGLYLALIMPMTFASRWLERRYALG